MSDFISDYRDNRDLRPDVIVLFYFIVCYLLNIVLFYSKYDVQECNPQTDQYVEVFQSIGQY